MRPDDWSRAHNAGWPDRTRPSRRSRMTSRLSCFDCRRPRRDDLFSALPLESLALASPSAVGHPGAPGPGFRDGPRLPLRTSPPKGGPRGLTPRSRKGPCAPGASRHWLVGRGDGDGPVLCTWRAGSYNKRFPKRWVCRRAADGPGRTRRRAVSIDRRRKIPF